MEATIELLGKITQLAMYEAPYHDDSAARQAWKDYTRHLGALLAAGRHGDAMALLVMLVGATTEQTDQMRHAPL